MCVCVSPLLPRKALNVPPALATHVTRELGKGLILILNKVDLTSPAVATAWSHLLRRRFPSARVVPFTSAPRRSPAPGRHPRVGVTQHPRVGVTRGGGPAPIFVSPPGLQRRQRRGGGWSRAVGPWQLLEACESIVGGEGELGRGVGGHPWVLMWGGGEEGVWGLPSAPCVGRTLLSFVLGWGGGVLRWAWWRGGGGGVQG